MNTNKMIKEIELCEAWISLQTKTEKINKNRTSYGYKHDVENWAEKYISNDAFKIAAKNSGLMIEAADKEGLNEYYNLVNIK